MKKIDIDEQKKIMLKMLSEFHNFCTENNIKYSLIGGSLIGAVRNGGIIPWDDDIDIILMPEEYNKLVIALKKKKFKYKFIGFNNLEKYFIPGFKIVDSDTRIIEKGIQKEYGVFVDVFRYNYIPDNFILRKYYLLKYKFILTIIHGFSSDRLVKRSFAKKIRDFYSDTKNKITYLNKYYNFLDKYNKKHSKNIISNSIMYSLDKEIQNSDNMKEYKIVNFDGVDAMIFSNYDQILKTTFGNYMTLPPVEKRVSKHTIDAFRVKVK